MIIASTTVETPPDLALTAPLNRRSVSWGAIFAGWSAGFALQLLFIMLGAGLGFAMFEPTSDDNPVASVGKGAVIIQGVSAVFSLWFGGWVAGRLLAVSNRRSALVHGFVVWCVSTIAGAIVVASGAGWMTGGLAKAAGGGLSALGKPAAAAVGGAADLAKESASQISDTLGSFTNESLKRGNQDPSSSEAIRAKREVGMAVARLFNPAQESSRSDNRAALVRVLVEQTGRSEAEANQMVADWTTSYDRLKQDLQGAKDQAAAKAKAVAEESSHNLAMFALGSFLAFVIGAIAASLGAKHGAACAERKDTRDLTEMKTV